MRKLVYLIVKYRKTTLLLFFLIAFICASLIPAVSINYDLSEYLPATSQSKIALDKLTQKFGYEGTSMLMTEDISIPEALALKKDLEKIEGISSVLWMDDIADLHQPLSYIDPAYLETYYQHGNALFFLNFTNDDYSLVTGEALVQARETAAAYNPAVYGTSESSRITRDIVADETFNLMVVIVPICLLILVLISSTWIHPLIFIFVIGVAVVINMGTNIIFDHVSFIIFSMGAVIQLAVSMDYSLFLTHRFEEEQAAGLPLKEALVSATQKSFPTILASTLTTIAGFSSMAIMTYGIGRDIGFVLAKGVAFSFVSAIFFLPPLLIVCHKWIEKTRHRNFFRIGAKMARGLIRPRYFFLIIGLIIILPAYLGQLNTGLLYGDSSGSFGEGQIADEKIRIEEHFGLFDQAILLFPDGNIGAEIALAEKLSQNPYINSVQGLVTVADPIIPRALLPVSVRENFLSDGYGRMILYLNCTDENKAMFETVDYIRKTAAAYYGDEAWLVGKASSITDIKESVRSDSIKVNLAGMLAVGLIIFFTFRSLLLPVLLVAAIQSAIYINMAIPYFLGEPLLFIGYIVVSALQLGATIDYAILFANRYMEGRRTLLPVEAATAALDKSGVSVMTSGIILVVAGFCEAFLSQLAAIGDIGLLIGRGALLSMAMVFFFLPALLILFDRPIEFLTFRVKFIHKPKKI